MPGATRKGTRAGAALVTSLVLSAAMKFSLFPSPSATAQVFDKVKVTKVADASAIDAGDVASFTIVVTTDAFPIDDVVLTDVLPAGLTWTVRGADAVAAGCAGVYAGGSTL